MAAFDDGRKAVKKCSNIMHNKRSKVKRHCSSSSNKLFHASCTWNVGEKMITILLLIGATRYQSNRRSTNLDGFVERIKGIM